MSIQGEAGQEAVQTHPKLIHFFVNGIEFSTDRGVLTGSEIKRIADVPADYELLLEPGDEVIHDHKHVHMREGMEFEAAPHGRVS